MSKKIFNFSPKIIAVAIAMTVTFFVLFAFLNPQYYFSQKIIIIPKSENIDAKTIAENISIIMETDDYILQLLNQTSKTGFAKKISASVQRGSVVQFEIHGDSFSKINNLYDLPLESFLTPIEKIYPTNDLIVFKTLDKASVSKVFQVNPLTAFISFILGLASSQAVYNAVAHIQERRARKRKQAQFNYSGAKPVFDWGKVGNSEFGKTTLETAPLDYNFQRNDFIKKSSDILKTPPREQPALPPKKSDAPANLPVLDGEVGSLEIIFNQSEKTLHLKSDENEQQAKLEQIYKDRLNRLLRGEDIE